MKEVTKTRTFTCNSCNDEIDEYVSIDDHHCVEVEAIHVVWGPVESFRLHFCDDCIPDTPLSDDWDTVDEVVFNVGDFSSPLEPAVSVQPQVTVVKVKWAAGYMGGESKFDRPQQFHGDVKQYIDIIEKACKDRDYDYGAKESGW